MTSCSSRVIMLMTRRATALRTKELQNKPSALLSSRRKSNHRKSPFPHLDLLISCKHDVGIAAATVVYRICTRFHLDLLLLVCGIYRRFVHVLISISEIWCELPNIGRWRAERSIGDCWPTNSFNLSWKTLRSPQSNQKACTSGAGIIML